MTAPIVDLTTATPVEIDRRAAELDRDHYRINSRITVALDEVHRALGERPRFLGRAGVRAWPTEHPDAVLTLHTASPDHDALTRLAAHHKALAGNQREARAIDTEYQRRPWTRYVGVQGGHIHAGMWCHGGTIRPTTVRVWWPELSGKPIDEAIAELQTTMCTHCFPDAPVAAVVPDDGCPGSGRSATGSIRRVGNGRYASCPECGAQQRLTQYGAMRKHKPPARG